MSDILAIIFSLLIGISVHECAHAYVANLLGDPTARTQGRITLNPAKHLDPLGTLMMIYAGLAGVGFGWGKPVPVNPYNFKKPNRDQFFVAIAGPLSNFIIAVLCSLILRIPEVSLIEFITKFLTLSMILNLGLMIFNLLPFPPLDGSAILGVLFPQTWKNYQHEFQKYGGILLLLLLFFGRGILSSIFTPIMNFFLNVLT